MVYKPTFTSLGAPSCIIGLYWYTLNINLGWLVVRKTSRRLRRMDLLDSGYNRPHPSCWRFCGYMRRLGVMIMIQFFSNSSGIQVANFKSRLFQWDFFIQKTMRRTWSPRNKNWVVFQKFSPIGLDPRFVPAIWFTFVTESSVSSWNSGYTFEPNEALPVWFLEDEDKYNKPLGHRRSRPLRMWRVRWFVPVAQHRVGTSRT